jgi:hypothetical protein
MLNLANQCLDLAKSLLQQNLGAVGPDGRVEPVPGESMRADEPGHVALAIGEYHRATNETALGKVDLLEMAARCIRAQVALREGSDNGLAYACLGLLSFGASRERNLVWDKLDADTRAAIADRLGTGAIHDNHFQAFDIAKAVCRFSLGMTDRDETGALVDRMVDGIAARGTGGFLDDAPADKAAGTLGGCYDLYGLVALVFARQALQLHANLAVRDAKLPRLRTHGEKYVRILLDATREDGMGWSYGRGIGAYGQMHPISILLQALRDKWVPADRETQARDLVRRLFTCFFGSFVDLEHGVLVIRDAERDTIPGHTTRMANFDAARYLCQWSRLARTLGGPLPSVPPTAPSVPCRYFPFDRGRDKEQGLCVYSDPGSGLFVQLPLVSGGGRGLSDSLAFPHMPGVMDWPVNAAQPCFIPEFHVGDRRITPSHYGRNAQVALGARGSTLFRYEQPELVDTAERLAPGLGSMRVEWEFAGGRMTGRFTLVARAALVIDAVRLALPLAFPHARLSPHGGFSLGPEYHRCEVIRDDFGCAWGETEVVSEDPSHRTCWGKIHYYQALRRDNPLAMRPGQALTLEVAFEPHIVRA